MIDKNEHLKFAIQRFDHYYDSVNNKGAFYVGLNTFILSGICVGYSSIHAECAKEFSYFEWAILIFLLALCLASTLLTILAIKPHLKDNHTNGQIPSLTYFGGIARHQLSYFTQKINSYTEIELLEDLIQQTHSLAKGLKQKFLYLKWASYLLIGQYFLIVPTIFLIFKILNK